MNRLEQIREDHSRCKTSHLYDGNWMDDIEYLLSKLEIAINALERVPHAACMMALKQIRE